MGVIELDSVERAIADIAAGKAVVVVDDEDRENEGDIIFAAELATPELVAFTVRYSSGYICAPLPGADCDRLGLPPMVARNEDVRGTAYTVTVDAATGSTGISASDRAYTIQRLAAANSEAAEFTRPGHGVPLRAAGCPGRAKCNGRTGTGCGGLGRVRPTPNRVRADARRRCRNGGRSRGRR